MATLPCSGGCRNKFDWLILSSPTNYHYYYKLQRTGLIKLVFSSIQIRLVNAVLALPPCCASLQLAATYPPACSSAISLRVSSEYRLMGELYCFL